MPPDHDSPSDRLDALEERVARLERAVSTLRTTGGEGESAAPSPDETTGDKSNRLDAPAAPSRSRSQSPAGAAEPDRTGPVSALDIRSEDWLNYAGIGLLLFGMAFLFKYSIDQGWLVPTVRVGTGALTGAILLIGGLRVYTDRRRLRQVLLGGSSAVFYGTVFAAYQLYSLLAEPVAFAAMVTITVASMALALQEDEAVMAVLGTAGGLGTPFLLYGDIGSVAGLAGYTCLVLAGAGAVYVYRGWRSLLYTAVAGGWAVLLVPCIEAGISGTVPDGRWGLQTGLLFAWTLLAGIPVIRASLHQQAPERWPVPPKPRWVERLLGRRPAFGLVTVSPTLALLGSRLLWGGPALLWAGVAAVGTVLYAAAFVALRRRPLPQYAPAHGLVAALLATYTCSEAFGGATLLLAWAVEGMILHGLARRLDDGTLRVVAHALFAGGTVWLTDRLSVPTSGETVLVSAPALSELGVLALLAGASRWLGTRWQRRLYQGVALTGWLGWWASELAAVPHGPVYVSAAWAGTAVALLVGGTWRHRSALRWAGAITLALFVAKLFLVDLTAVPALWRVVLFLGAGGSFLLLSYILPHLGLRPPGSYDVTGD